MSQPRYNKKKYRQRVFGAQAGIFPAPGIYPIKRPLLDLHIHKLFARHISLKNLLEPGLEKESLIGAFVFTQLVRNRSLHCIFIMPCTVRFFEGLMLKFCIFVYQDTASSFTRESQLTCRSRVFEASAGSNFLTQISWQTKFLNGLTCHRSFFI